MDIINSATSFFHASPIFPPTPNRPPPTSPPLPLSPPLVPLIICPPALPPPLPPPGMSVWASAIPLWFWGVFTTMLALALTGLAALVHEYRERRRRLRIPMAETLRTLEELERRIAKV